MTKLDKMQPARKKDVECGREVQCTHFPVFLSAAEIEPEEIASSGSFLLVAVHHCSCLIHHFSNWGKSWISLGDYDSGWVVIVYKMDGKWRNVISQGWDHPCTVSLSHDWWHIHQPTRARQRRGVRTHHVYLGSDEGRGGLRAIHHVFNIRKKLKNIPLSNSFQIVSN